MRIPRPVEVSAVLGLLVWGGVAWTPAASAATSQCLVINATSAASYTSLQAAQDAADAGTTLWLRGTCTGTTKIIKNLTITGQHRRGFTAPTLKGSGPGSVLKIRSGITLTVNTLTITGGKAFEGGGIFVNIRGSLTLNNVTVSGNAANFSSHGIMGGGGGIFNNGKVTLNGSTIITGNTGFSDAGGIGSQGAHATVTLNDNATITGNTAGRRGGGIFNWVGTVTLNDNATITGNTAAATDGGGIFNLCGTLKGAVAGAGGNVFSNKPDDIVTACA